MKKAVIACMVILFGSTVLLAGVSFKGFLPGVAGWKGEIREKPETFAKSGYLLAQKRYVHEKRTRWIKVSVLMGNQAMKKLPFPIGYNLIQKIVVMYVRRIQGYAVYFTYYPKLRKGNAIVFFPAGAEQKHYGNVAFMFHNVRVPNAEAFMRKFDFKRIHGQMKKLK